MSKNIEEIEIAINFKDQKNWFSSWKKCHAKILINNNNNNNINNNNNDNDNNEPSLQIIFSKSKEFKLEITKISLQSIDTKGKPDCQQIKGSGKTFLISPFIEKSKFLFAMKEFQNFKDKLFKLGATKNVKKEKKSFFENFASKTESDDKTKKKDNRTRIEKLNVEKWTSTDVIQWIKILQKINIFEETIEPSFKENDISGSVLVQLKDKDLKAMGINLLKHRFVILREIKKLIENKTFDFKPIKILEKINHLSPITLRRLKKAGSMDLVIKALCDADMMEKIFFNSKQFEKKNKNNNNNNNNYNNNNNTSTTSTTSTTISHSESLVHSLEEEENDNDENINVDEIADIYEKKRLDFFKNPEKIFQKENHLNDDNAYTTDKNRIPVRLVISELCTAPAETLFRSVFSPIISSIPTLSAKFGMFHTGILIGPWYLEWVDGSIIFPKKIVGSLTILAVDIDTITTIDTPLTEIAKKLAQLCVEWNINNKYTLYRLSGLKSNEGNCQTFVDACFKTLGIEPNFVGPIKKFIDEMRNHGKSELCFNPTKEFQERFQLNETSYKFQTHKELDKFVNQLTKKCLTFKVDYPDELMLLKSFDRGFWVRHLCRQKNPEYAPLFSDDGKLDCPFGDPRKTGTLMGQ